ncbi:MAG: tandem-95 repeat protein, partial [Candidatus Caenarcaniphilales bacterium]|nr:tandem-95 repeat protein [Candidatus Caenarcaniphilales bacterium]
MSRGRKRKTSSGDGLNQDKGKNKRKRSDFSVLERIVPGSFMFVIPYLAQAWAGDNIFTFDEVPSDVVSEDETLFFPILSESAEPNPHNQPLSSHQVDIEPNRISSIEEQPFRETSYAALQAPQSSLRETSYSQLEIPEVQSREIIQSSIPEFFVQDDSSDPITPDMPMMPDIPKAPGNLSPQALLDVNSQTNQGVPVLFDASRSFDLDGQIVRYDFDFGDGSIYSETPDNAPDGLFDGKTFYTYNTLGGTQTSVTVTDNKGATDTDTKNINVVNIKPIFLSPGDTDPSKAGIEDSILGDTAHTTDKVGTVWIEGKLDAVKNDGSLDSISNVVQYNSDWTAIAKAYDPDGLINKYDFWIDINKDGTYSSSEYIGMSTNGEIGIDHTKIAFKAGETYSMAVRVTDDDGGTAVSYDTFRVNSAPIFLTPGDTNPKTPGIEDPTLSDPGHITDKSGTPWIEGKLDAVKNDPTDPATSLNVVPANEDWTSIAKAYDTDGSIKDYHFFIKDESGSFVDAGNSSTGIINIDHTDFSFIAGNSYEMKVIATDNNGTTSESIDVFKINSPPDAKNDSLVTNEDSLLSFSPNNLLFNDTDPEANPLTISTFTDPTNGTLSFDGTKFTYNPDPNFKGSDTFTYTISDGQGGSDTATVTINVSSVNDAPNALDDSVVTDEDTPTSFNVLDGSAGGLDSDLDLDTLTVISKTDPINGSITWDPAGNFTYTPNANFNGTDSFTYTISDGNGGLDTATVFITVNSINDIPVAKNDSYSTNEDTALTVPAKGILSNDSDIDGDSLSSILVSGPSNGVLTLNPDGS